MSMLSNENEADTIAYGSLMQYQSMINELRGDDIDISSPFILCGSQKSARFARSEISQHYDGRISVIFSSREADVACWRVSLRNYEAHKLASSSAFFHVSQIPAVAKFAPDLLTLGSTGYVGPAYQVLKKGIRVNTEIRVNKLHLLDRWRDEKFGMTSNDRLDYLYPLSDHASIHSWKRVRNAIESGVCVDVINPVISKDTELSGDHLLHVSFEKSSSEAILEDCVVAVLAYVATQNEILNIEVIPSFVLHVILPDTTSTSTLSLDDEHVVVKPMNTISTTALQSGNENEPNPFWNLGINGTGQYVEVSDTGFDDASCFLRQENSAAYLTGDLNTDYQVVRSGYSSPTTDHTRRKVVQYLMRDTSDSEYAQDYASGHGSHCVGTVAGYIPNDGSTQDPDDDYYSNCADYLSYCDSWFSPTGDYAGTCDTTCGIAPSDAYSGMAPGAKLMVYDFGNAGGGLDVPTDMQTEVYQPAYDEGARITSNSWGSGAPYNGYSSQAINIDQFVYDADDVLVVFAAGNNGGASDDDTYTNGDATIGAPAICKNVLTIGAAETAYTPDTVASFSSRGPTKDMRLKPEVCGPGDPVTSTKASGLAGLASCAATSKSGTSMATPAVAGTAALIREILVEGKHQDFSSAGYGGSSYSESAPSGALLKALLIGSTVRLTYGYDSSGNSVTLSDFYGASSAVADSTAYALGTTGVDFTQGFGHVRLSNIFSLDGSFDTFCYEDSLAEYSTWTQTYVVSSVSERLAITLVWSDPPGAVSCGYYYELLSTDTCLIHDLDLKVYNDGTRLYSNFGAGDGDYSGQEDTLNNAEKVTIETSDLTVGTTIMVTVETNGLSYADTQKFAVVVRGTVASSGSTPTDIPNPTPTSHPVVNPTMKPTDIPIPTPTSHPVVNPTMKPTDIPIPTPTSHPVVNPTMKPTDIPIPTPTSHPVVNPTMKPTLNPTNRYPVSFPTDLPSQRPVFSPNKYPNPTPFPSSHRPAPVPTESPVRGPSLSPSSTPTRAPSVQPTVTPSLVPTTTDTVTIITSFDLTSNDIPTSNDATSLKSSIAEALNVSEASIKGFTLTYSGFRRVRRHLLTTYTWTANFKLTVSLASTPSSTIGQFKASISFALTSATFVSAVSAVTGATVDVSSVTISAVTRSPTSAPTTAPSSQLDKKRKKKSKSVLESTTGFGAASLGGIAVGVIVLLVGCGYMIHRLCSPNRGEYLVETDSHGFDPNFTVKKKTKRIKTSFSRTAVPPPPTNIWLSESESPMTISKNPSSTIHGMTQIEHRRSAEL